MRTAVPLLLLLTCYLAQSSATSLPAHLVVTSPLQIFNSTAQAAAQAAALSIQHQLQSEAVDVLGVKLDTLQLLQGQQQQVVLEVGGQPHKFILSGEPQWLRLADALHSSQNALVPEHGPEAAARAWLHAGTEGAVLDDFVLAGPLELVLEEPVSLSLAVPHQVDAGPLRRVVLGEGTAVQVRGARSVRLGHPVDLPPLPDEYLAEIWGLPVGGKLPGGVGPLAGVMHVASGLRSMAAQWWSKAVASGGRAGGVARAAPVTLELQVASWGGLTTAPATPGGAPARLKVQRLGPHSVQLTVRQSQDALSTQLETPWAWPCPAAPPSALAPHEQMLRELLARQPADLLIREPSEAGPGGRGPALRLLGSSVEALAVVQVEVEVRHQRKGGNRLPVPGLEGREGVFDLKSGVNELWHAVVRLQPDGAGGVTYVPLQANLLDAAHSTISFSPEAEYVMRGNFTLPTDMEYRYPNMGF